MDRSYLKNQHSSVNRVLQINRGWISNMGEFITQRTDCKAAFCI